MRLKPHQYVLIAIILALGAWNLHRLSHARTAAAPPAAPHGTSAAWPAFDAAAQLRDADEAQWQPALTAMNSAIAAATTEREDLNACRTWLLFYRDEHLHPTNRPGFAGMTQHHVDLCVAQHRDAAQ
jgi:hypothetical protein